MRLPLFCSRALPCRSRVSPIRLRGHGRVYLVLVYDHGLFTVQGMKCQ